jgi:hypothetical protein
MKFGTDVIPIMGHPNLILLFPINNINNARDARSNEAVATIMKLIQDPEVTCGDRHSRNVQLL